MDSGFTVKRENPLNNSNIFSKLIFGWMIKLCYKGTKKNLDVSDLYKVLTCDESEKLTDKLEKNWEDEVNKALSKPGRSPSLFRAIVKTYFWKYMLFGVALFVQMIFFRSFQPVVLAYFIHLFSFDDGAIYTNEMYISGSIIVLQSLFVVFFMHHCEFGQSAIGMRIRIAVSSLVYRKLLRLNKKSLGQTAAGQVVNLLSNDVQRFDMVTLALHYFWIMPFQVVLVTYLMWREVGISTLAGVLSMVILTLPVQGYLGKLTSHLRLQVAQRTDFRVKLMSEVIAGIQVIKMYAWEKPFEIIVKEARRQEINVLTKASYLRGVYVSCMVFIERTTLYLTIVCYVLLGNNITADIVFSLAQFYNILQLAMAIFYPMAITFGAESLVSIKRLQEFLVLDEKPPSRVENTDQKGVVLEKVNASWTPHVETIKNFDLEIPEGTLCAIVGPVGAGKSSLLNLLLGELPAVTGKIKIGGSISYSSQEPWLFASTVRNNILFGQEYNRFLYKQVVHVCALEPDFHQFPQNDKTMVGERGVSLSGGQRARINLARAVYRPADIYLFDDPLSAVDTHVGKHLFEECIVKFLKNKTRILVTHQLQYLKKADVIVVVNEGKIEAKGSFHELTHKNLDFTKLLVAADETVVEKEQEETTTLERKYSVMSDVSILSEASTVYEVENNDEKIDMSNNAPFRDYVKASGNCYTLSGLLTILILGQTACSSADYFVTFWTQQEAIRALNGTELQFVALNNTESRDHEVFYKYWYDELSDEVVYDDEIRHLIKTDVAMYIYTAIIITLILLTLLRSFAYFKMSMIASKNLHKKMFNALLKAPMRFFDLNPSGRVLNRFSKDIGAIDEVLPRFLMDAIQILLVMSGILVMVTIANYYMVITMVVLGVLFLKVRSWYVLTAKDVKHLEGITKSPVYSHLSSSLNGITTIRACQVEKVLQKEFDNHQNAHTSAWFLTIASRVCFGLWLDLISVTFVAVVIYCFILLNQHGAVSGSVVGLAISQSLILTGMLQYGMRQTAEVVNQLTSVERVMEYTKLECEEKLDVDNLKEAKRSWPNRGLIQFINLSLKYSENGAAVLNHLNFSITPGNKVGIVGRTGAGKSSLISALFRLAPIEGSIVIDGVDTKTIRLADLRNKISIIPQEPVLFSATLRYNLDPFQEFKDDDLWNALEEVELKEVVSSLDFMVSERGSNFSLGQRQLICLARAILRNNKILVLDEATANVDPRTDSLIQTSIRKKFKSCTVLTIAHRLNTIMDSDKVLVMADGRMVEYNHPHLLLQDHDGYFSKMVAETGPTMTQQLKKISLDAYLSMIKES